MNEFVILSQGSGGKQTHQLIEEVFVRRFGMTLPLTDSAILKDSGNYIAYTTDSYVVDPLFFPGGNIGKLAVCGTINDLAVSGAIPEYLSTSFIIEEGFRTDQLILIAETMAEEARKAGVKIVTGDTKVVERGKCDKLFITTSGIGSLRPELEHISIGRSIVPGDKLIINGPLGNHAIAVLGARKKLSFSTPVISDCASLNRLTQKILQTFSQVRFMRDITRGGLATVLNELAEMTGSGIVIDEDSVPVDDPVKGLCEILGFDPLNLANEGKVLIVVGSDEADCMIELLRSDALGEYSEIIGEIIVDDDHQVVLNTSVGGKRLIESPSGQQVPRIC